MLDSAPVEIPGVGGRRGRLQLHRRRDLRLACGGLWTTLVSWFGVLVVMSTVIEFPASRGSELINFPLKLVVTLLKAYDLTL